MQLKQLFEYLNNTDFMYVVLRNWENLPDNVDVGIHSDLDLLVYDSEHFEELFPDIKRVYPPPRVQHRMPCGDSFINIDVRLIGDGYYPTRFQQEILSSRVLNKNGFYTPNEACFKVALAYHAVHHKNCNKYQTHLGDTTIPSLLEALKETNIGWCKPDDLTVGAYHGYLKGSTSTVDKKDGKVVKTQNLFFDFDLVANEARILGRLHGRHFPKLIAHEGQTLEIDDCGDILKTTNKPKDWKKQLLEIQRDLKSCGVVHRDIRPNNLLVKDGVVKLIDFGWARLEIEQDTDVPTPEGLCSVQLPTVTRWYKPYEGFSDKFSIKKIIKEIEYREEQCTS